MTTPAPLDGMRVVDLSTVIAGPNCARYLADFGATCIKVERPGVGDSLRNMGWRDPVDDSGLWWKQVNRNKRTIALDLKQADDLAVARRLLADADVLVENFRPGTLERLGLDPDRLIAANPRLVITRITGFGQTGRYADRPGFATIAEAMSGLAAISGDPDGPPLLPPIALTDELTGLVGAFATMVAVHSGVGQVVDVSLLESVFQMMSPLVSLYGRTGQMQQRMKAALPYSVPRGTYRCADERWVALSASSDRAAHRLMTMLGLGDDPRLASFAGRETHRGLIDERLAEWCAVRSRDDVLSECEAAEVAVGSVLDMAEIAADPYFTERQAIVDVGGVPMQGLIAKLSATPGRLTWPGRPIDADGAQIRETGWPSE